MASSFDKFQKRRLISSYFSVVISVFLVLFLLGTLGFFVINSKKISNYFKEQIPMSIYFKDQANDSLLNAFTRKLKTARYVKDFVFVPKDEAAKQHQEVIGEDFIAFIGTNPLKNSFDLHLKADYVVADSLQFIEKELVEFPEVYELVYDKYMVELVNDNVAKITFWMLVVCGFFTVIAVLLINSSMRLAIYSNRFIIKTMQMVGATKSFIRRPFIWRSVRLGIIGSLLAVAAIFALLQYVDEQLPSLGIFDEPLQVALILGGVVLFGVVISWFSTFFATQRFLNLRTDDLY